MSRFFKVVVRYRERGEQQFRWTYRVLASGIAEARQKAVIGFRRMDSVSSAGCAREIVGVDAVEHLPDGMVAIQGHAKGCRHVFRISGLPGSGTLEVFAGTQGEALERAIDLCGNALAVIILDNGMSFFVKGENVRRASLDEAIQSCIE